MNDVLLQLQNTLRTTLVEPFKVGRVEVGQWVDSLSIFRDGDLSPVSVLIEPLGEEIKQSPIANHLSKEYSVRIYALTRFRVPKQSQIVIDKTNQGKTLNEYTNEIIRILGANKRLTAKVRLQSSDFTIDNYTDNADRQVKSIRVRYVDDLIPYASATINQTNMIKQI